MGTVMKMAVVSIVCLLVGACSIKGARIGENNKEQLLEDATWSMFVSGEEVDLLSSAFRESAITGKPIDGKTVGRVLAEQKQIRADEEKARQAKSNTEEMGLKETKTAEELARYVTVTASKKQYLESDIYEGVFDSRIQIDMVIENKSDKDIKFFSGKAVFRDRDGNVLLTRFGAYYGLDYGDIEAGGKKVWIGNQRYNRIDPHDRILKNTALEDLRFEWQTRRITFADGLSMGME